MASLPQDSEVPIISRHTPLSAGRLLLRPARADSTNHSPKKTDKRTNTPPPTLSHHRVVVPPRIWINSSHHANKIILGTVSTFYLLPFACCGRGPSDDLNSPRPRASPSSSALRPSPPPSPSPPTLALVLRPRASPSPSALTSHLSPLASHPSSSPLF